MTTHPQLADLMRESSHADHREAESTSFISQLLSGQLSLLHYRALLAQYLHLYTALEDGAATVRQLSRSVNSEQFARLLDPRLDRAALIRADLKALGAPSAAMLPSTAEYVGRVRHVSASSPHRFLAHHYVRLLGDLSGGQILSRKIQQHYGATADELSAWEFSELGKLKPYKDDYRARLNGLRLDEAQVAEVLAEVRLAFGFNTSLFRDLSATPPAPSELAAVPLG